MASTTLTTFPPPPAGRDKHAGPQPAGSGRRASAAVRGDACRLVRPRLIEPRRPDDVANRRSIKAGTFDSGIETALAFILVSPQFLFRFEKDPDNIPAGSNYHISDLELASRLSFFIWSSIPDDQLLDVAIKGRLKVPAVLEAQVKRMLADERARALGANFAGQWLYLRNLKAKYPIQPSFCGEREALGMPISAVPSAPIIRAHPPRVCL